MQIEYHHFATLSSTNDFAKTTPSLFEKGKLHVVAADVQSGGRGRYERRWHSVKGGLYASFCFIQDKGEALDMIYLMVRAVTEVLKDEGVNAELKRPNDLMVDQKKIAGMLLEPIGTGRVLGLGLNVNQTEDELRDVGQRAISLSEVTGKKYEIKALLESVAMRFASALSDCNS